MEKETEMKNLSGKKARKPQAVEEHKMFETKIKKMTHKMLMLEVVVGILSALMILMLVIVIVMASSKPPSSSCQFQESDYVKPRNFDNPERLDDLTPEEYKSILSYMFGVKELRLISFDSATPNSSYILSADLFLPSKKEVIEYSVNRGKRPQRKALVTVIRGDANPPAVEEYIISPLPKPNSAQLYKNPSYRRYPIPFSSRPMDTVNYIPLYQDIITPAMEKLYPLLMESYGRAFHNCTSHDDCLIMFDTAPRGKKSGERKVWFKALADHDGYLLHPLGFEMLIEHKSTDVTQWKIEMVVYNGIKFHSVDSLMNAYYSKTLKMINRKGKDLSYSAYGAKGDPLGSPIQGPRLFEPEGKRYKLDGQHVKYGKWSFHYHMTTSNGLQIFDVKFDGTRIAYEISLQEVMVLYTGYGPTQANSDFYDVSWFLGSSDFELTRGIDCPETAVFKDTYMLYNSAHVQRIKHNICIFENNGAIPMRRHYSNNYEEGYKFYGGLSDYHLVIRTITTSGNYDYIFDYIFYNNGVVEIKSSSTGYVFATFRLPEEEQYGGIIHDQVVADLHAHMFNYNIDIDVDGVKNRYMIMDVDIDTIPDQWTENHNRSEMIITKTVIEKESKTQTYKNDVPQYHVFYKNNSTNKYGSHKFYRIINKDPIPFLEYKNPVAHAGKWANYPIIVTRRKDEELKSTTVYAQSDPYDPVLDFEDFINGESLLDEDLVAWVTTGTYHIPGTEDVPSTPTTWNQYSIFLTPHNYFTECPSVSSTDNVLIKPPKDGKSKPTVNSYGRSFESTCIPQTAGPNEYDGMRHNV